MDPDSNPGGPKAYRSPDPDSDPDPQHCSLLTEYITYCSVGVPDSLNPGSRFFHEKNLAKIAFERENSGSGIRIRSHNTAFLYNTLSAFESSF
jgi:hypothetical protein